MRIPPTWWDFFSIERSDLNISSGILSISNEKGGGERMKKVTACTIAIVVLVCSLVVSASPAKALTSNDLGNYLILQNLFNNGGYPYYTYPAYSYGTYPTYYYYPSYGYGSGINYNNLGNLLILDRLFNNGNGLFR